MECNGSEHEICAGGKLQLHFNLYGIPVSADYGTPDILLTLNATSGGTGLAMYCNPNYGAFADPNSNYPGPDYAVWYSGQLPLVMHYHALESAGMSPFPGQSITW